MNEQTLFIIKPNAVAAGATDAILKQINNDGFVVAKTKTLRMTRQLAEEFYAEHRGKPFYEKLIEFMTSGDVVVGVAERNDAIKEMRRLVGATDPAEAAEGTVRKLYGIDRTKNAIHASDSPQSAEREQSILFGR